MLAGGLSFGVWVFFLVLGVWVFFVVGGEERLHCGKSVTSPFSCAVAKRPEDRNYPSGRANLEGSKRVV